MKFAKSRSAIASIAQGLPLLGILMIALMWGGILHLSNIRGAAAEFAARQSLRNLSRVFEEHVTRAIREVDRILLVVGNSYVENPTDFNLRKLVNNSEFRSELTAQFALVGADGYMLSSNLGPAQNRLYLGDREHFRIHLDRDFEGLFISKPVLGRASGKWTIQLSRAFRKSDGTLAAVLVASIDPYHFSRFYESVDLGTGGAITLVGFDGIIRARGGMTPDSLGRSIAASNVITLAQQQGEGLVWGNGTIDGATRLLAFRTVRNFPLIVMVGMTKAGMLTERDEASRYYNWLGLGLTLLLLITIGISVRHNRKLDISNCALAAERDRAESASRAKSSFLATMSHEIRTPMNAVLGLCSSLLERPLPEEDLRLVRLIHSSGDSLLEILNDILDYSKLEAGKITMENIDFSPIDELDNALSIVAPRAEAKALQVEKRFDSAIPATVVGDAGRIRQVLLNLISNAVKFTAAGSIQLELKCSSRNDTHATLQWVVSDTGIGIPQDRIGSLFNDYVQADHTINRRFGGSGLGLSICKRIVEAMGGEIVVRSTIGAGTTVTVTIRLPIGKQECQAEICQLDNTPKLNAFAANLGRQLRILVVDDNSTNRLVAAKMLEQFNVHISTAGDGAEAITAALSFPYDIVLMDVRMPEMDGIQATRAIRAAGHMNSKVPIIALTANAYEEDVRNCIEAGMNGFVAKPIRKKILIDEIVRVLSKGHVRHDTDTAKVAPAQPAASHPGVEAEQDFDHRVLDELAKELGTEGLPEAVDAFRAEMDSRISTLRCIALEGNRGAIGREAHTIKGAAATFGLGRLSRSASRLEQEAEQIDAGAFAAAIGNISDAFSAASPPLIEYLDRRARTEAA